MFDLKKLDTELKKKGAYCYGCKETITVNPSLYEHDGGLSIKGYSEKQWVYYECPKCGYQTSAIKLLNQIVVTE